MNDPDPGPVEGWIRELFPEILAAIQADEDAYRREIEATAVPPSIAATIEELIADDWADLRGERSLMLVAERLHNGGAPPDDSLIERVVTFRNRFVRHFPGSIALVRACIDEHLPRPCLGSLDPR